MICLWCKKNWCVSITKNGDFHLQQVEKVGCLVLELALLLQLTVVIFNKTNGKIIDTVDGRNHSPSWQLLDTTGNYETL